MANPTTNYGFVLPTSSDLVTDLPADFDVALQGVDTRLKALQPGTTLGDLAYSSATANTNTRLPIGTSGQVLAVSGAGVPAWTTTADVTPLTTKGDLFTYTTVDARIGVGANGTVLTADSAEATGLKWATPAGGGSMTLLSTTTLSGSTTTVSSISQSYKNLYIEINGMSISAFAATINYLTNSTACVVYNQQAAAATGVNYFSTAGTLGNGQNYANLSTNNKANWTIFDYTDAANNKPGFFNQRWINEGGSPIYVQGGMVSNHTAAVTSISMTISTGTFNGGTLRIYGVN